MEAKERTLETKLADYITHYDLTMWEVWPEWARGRWPNFSPWEFRSGKSREFLISCRLLDGLQQLRNELGVGLFVNQPENGLTRRGFRTVEDNRMAGGTPNSQHLSGRASDVDAGGKLSPYAIAQAAKKIECFKNGGIIIYATFVHLDVRPASAYYHEK